MLTLRFCNLLIPCFVPLFFLSSDTPFCRSLAYQLLYNSETASAPSRISLILMVDSEPSVLLGAIQRDSIKHSSHRSHLPFHVLSAPYVADSRIPQNIPLLSHTRLSQFFLIKRSKNITKLVVKITESFQRICIDIVMVKWIQSYRKTYYTSIPFILAKTL